MSLPVFHSIEQQLWLEMATQSTELLIVGYREGVRPSVLDAILSSEEGLVENLTYQPPIGSSNHVVLVFELACCTRIPETMSSRLNYPTKETTCS